MPVIQDTYKPKIFFRNGHIHTIYPAFFRKVEFKFTERKRFTLSDGDFIDLDLHKEGNNELVVLCHGLEGGSSSSYILTTAQYFATNGFDIMAINYRSCSGEMNRKEVMYHHGATEDVHEAISAQAQYKKIHLIGWSLGGNLALKYTGEPRERPANLKSVIGFSVPIDLISCVNEIHKPKNRLYVINFLKTLRKKIEQKAQLIPHKISTEWLREIKTLTHFDTYYTAPLHGFKSAEDYYIKSSSKQFIPKIEIPALLVNAKDDPMLGDACYPKELAEQLDNFYYLETKYGGHCGFIPPKGEVVWMEKIALDFIQKYT